MDNSHYPEDKMDLSLSKTSETKMNNISCLLENTSKIQKLTCIPDTNREKPNNGYQIGVFSRDPPKQRNVNSFVGDSNLDGDKIPRGLSIQTRIKNSFSNDRIKNTQNHDVNTVEESQSKSLASLLQQAIDILSESGLNNVRASSNQAHYLSECKGVLQ